MTSLQLMAYGGEYGVPFTGAWAIFRPPGTALNATSDATEGRTRAVAVKRDWTGDDELVLKCLREVEMEYSVNNHPPMRPSSRIVRACYTSRANSLGANLDPD